MVAMHGRTMRSLPKDLSAAVAAKNERDKKEGREFNRKLYEKRTAQAMTLWAAAHILKEFGFHTHGNSVDRIATNISVMTIDPIEET